MVEIQNARDDELLSIDPTPRFELSRYLYMQFMEPLGVTDGSVQAAWDMLHDRWREDFVRAAQALAPTLIRWPGGCFASYYRWQEGIGPRTQRKPMLNLLWGGIESNQVGTHEFIEFCRLVGADPLLVVNFESDGRKEWAYPACGGIRWAGPEEAAAWVDYCNNPDNPARRRNGAAEPFGVHLWQIGNETSYDPEGWDCETAAARTLAFARMMHAADPTIALIGWGDSGWARRMLEVAGEELQYIAFHIGVRSTLAGSPLGWNAWRLDPALTWDHLMSASLGVEKRINEMREAVRGYKVHLALTEGHFAPPGRNRSDVLFTWAAGVANARVLNVYERNGDLLKIATLADMAGTRWTNNAIMIPVPEGASYLLPVGRVMALFGKHTGQQAVSVVEAPRDLDVVASRSDDRLFLHVVNTNRATAVPVRFQVGELPVYSGTIRQIATDPMVEIEPATAVQFEPKVYPLPADGRWCFPAAAVAAIEISLDSDVERRNSGAQLAHTATALVS